MVAPQGAMVGNIYLTGHDVLLHDGQNGCDTVILDFLRGAGTPSEIPSANYRIGVIGSGVGSWEWSTVGDGVPTGFANTTFYNTAGLAVGAELRAQALSGDVRVILSHTSRGGGDLSNAGSAALNSMPEAIAAEFNDEPTGRSNANELGIWVLWVPKLRSSVERALFDRG